MSAKTLSPTERAVAVVLLVVVVSVPLAALFFGVHALVDWSCRSQASHMKLSGKAPMSGGGCFVEVGNDRWVPLSAIVYDLRRDAIEERKR